MTPTRRTREVKKAAKVPRLGSAIRTAIAPIVSIAAIITNTHKKVNIIYIITPILNISIKIPKVIIMTTIRKSLPRLSIYLV